MAGPSGPCSFSVWLFRYRNKLAAMMHIPHRPPPTLSRRGDWSPEFHDFLSCCLTKNPAQRQGADTLRLHPFVGGVIRFLSFTLGCSRVLQAYLKEIRPQMHALQRSKAHRHAAKEFAANPHDEAAAARAVATASEAASAKQAAKLAVRKKREAQLIQEEYRRQQSTSASETSDLEGQSDPGYSARDSDGPTAQGSGSHRALDSEEDEDDPDATIKVDEKLQERRTGHRIASVDKRTSTDIFQTLIIEDEAVDDAPAGDFPAPNDEGTLDFDMRTFVEQTAKRESLRQQLDMSAVKAFEASPEGGAAPTPAVAAAIARVGSTIDENGESDVPSTDLEGDDLDTDGGDGGTESLAHDISEDETVKVDEEAVRVHASNSAVQDVIAEQMDKLELEAAALSDATLSVSEVTSTTGDRSNSNRSSTTGRSSASGQSNTSGRSNASGQSKEQNSQLDSDMLAETVEIVELDFE